MTRRAIREFPAKLDQKRLEQRRTLSHEALDRFLIRIVRHRAQKIGLLPNQSSRIKAALHVGGTETDVLAECFLDGMGKLEYTV